jgi:hypothetical protein
MRATHYETCSKAIAGKTVKDAKPPRIPSQPDTSGPAPQLKMTPAGKKARRH